MRDIKLRAWDYDDQQFLSMRFAVNGKLMLIDVGKEWVDPAVIERFEVNQFTGLQDAKGVDIYEGDIIHWKCLKLPVTVEEFHGYRFMWGKDVLCKVIAEGEVIGNIYENPELLNN